MNLFRSAKFFKIETPLGVDEMLSRFEKVGSKSRSVNDKNILGQKITLGCKFSRKRKMDGNYILNVSIEYQIHPKKGMPYQTARDLLTFVFFINQGTLVVLGRDDAMQDAVNTVQEVAYPNVEDMRMFRPVALDVESLVKTITVMKSDDPNSWCSDYGGVHDAVKYQNRKTKSNFSLGEGKCVLDDPEAIEAIKCSTTISPRYKFYVCPKLNEHSYNKPKTMLFNGKNGSITIFTPQEFEDWYRFILYFLLESLVFSTQR